MPVSTDDGVKQIKMLPSCSGCRLPRGIQVDCCGNRIFEESKLGVLNCIDLDQNSKMFDGRISSEIHCGKAQTWKPSAELLPGPFHL